MNQQQQDEKQHQVMWKRYSGSDRVEILKQLIDSAIDANQRVVLRADFLTQNLADDQALREVIAIKEDSIRGSEDLHKIQRIIDS
jgi:hypothetical protein